MGVDIGTTGVKAAVFDEQGNCILCAYEEYPLLTPFFGAGELDSNRLVQAALRAIAQSADEVKRSDPVRCIGIASQGEAFVPISTDGCAMANAMTSSDRRAVSYVEQWTSQFGAERLYRITGHTAHPMFTLFKLLWLKEHRTDVWENAKKFLFCQDLIAFELTGEYVTDQSMAARSMMYDVGRGCWSDEILNALELDKSRLPEVKSSGEVVGRISARAAESLGLASDVTVSVCGHDQPVGALGCCAARPGMASYAIGTVECVTPSADRLMLNQGLMENNLASYPHVLPGLYTTVAFNLTGGCVLRWVRDNLAGEEVGQAESMGVDPYEHIIESASPKPSGLIMLPHFGPTGTPHFDPRGVGVIFGLTLSSSRSEIFRAFLEGITYEMKWNLSILAEAGFHLSELRAIGGGSKSDTWMQIKADILKLPIMTMQVSEATCAGAAMLAGSGSGLIDMESAQSTWARPVKTFEPQADNCAYYEDSFAVYKNIYNSLADSRRMFFTSKGDRND